MKKLKSPQRRLQLVLGAVWSLALLTAAAAEPGEPTNVPQPAPTGEVKVSSPSATVSLPYGAADVVKLTQAQIGEDTIVRYVQNSGTVYNLSSQDIVNLRNQGVSERVISAMLNQKSAVAVAAAPSAPQAPTAAPPAPASGYPADNAAPANSQPAPVYAQAPLVPAPSSSVYVNPYPPVAYAYGYPYYYSPYYYGGYYGPYYYGPRISIGIGGFGFGFHHYGYYGGGHWGGGHWGGGHWGGGHHR